MGSRSAGGCRSAPGGAATAVAAAASLRLSAHAARVGIQIRDTMPPSMLSVSRVYREAAAPPLLHDARIHWRAGERASSCALMRLQATSFAAIRREAAAAGGRGGH